MLPLSCRQFFCHCVEVACGEAARGRQSSITRRRFGSRVITSLSRFEGPSPASTFNSLLSTSQSINQERRPRGGAFVASFHPSLLWDMPLYCEYWWHKRGDMVGRVLPLCDGHLGMDSRRRREEVRKMHAEGRSNFCRAVGSVELLGPWRLDEFEEVNGDRIFKNEGRVVLTGRVVAIHKLSRKLAFVRLACDNTAAACVRIERLLDKHGEEELLQIKLDIAWLERGSIQEVEVGTVVTASGWPCVARSKKSAAATLPPALLLLAVELNVIQGKETDSSGHNNRLEPETQLAGLRFDLKPSQMRGKKHADAMHLRQLLPTDEPGMSPEFPTSWWCSSLVTVGLGRHDPLPMRDLVSRDECLCNIQCTAEQAKELGVLEECEPTTESLTEYCYPMAELLHPTSRFLKRACRDINAALTRAESGEASEGLALTFLVEGGDNISEDTINRCCICRAQWRAAKPPGAISKRDTYLSALRRIRGKLGRRTALLALVVAGQAGDPRSGSVAAYVVTEALPGKTVVAVDGCCCVPELRGADAYLLHAAARHWKPFAKWLNDGPAANDGIRKHKRQHHGVVCLAQVRFRPTAPPRGAF